MPRIPSRPPAAPTVGQPRAPETGAPASPTANPDAFEAKPKATFEAYFTPYEPAQKAELAALDAVLEARAADSTARIPPGTVWLSEAIELMKNFW